MSKSNRGEEKIQKYIRNFDDVFNKAVMEQLEDILGTSSITFESDSNKIFLVMHVNDPFNNSKRKLYDGDPIKLPINFEKLLKEAYAPSMLLKRIGQTCLLLAAKSARKRKKECERRINSIRGDFDARKTTIGVRNDGADSSSNGASTSGPGPRQR